MSDDEAHAIAGCKQCRRIVQRIEQRQRVRPMMRQPPGPALRIDAGLRTADADAAGRYTRARRVQAWHRQARIEAEQIRKPGRESEHRHAVFHRAMARDDVVFAKPGCVARAARSGPSFAAVTHRNLDRSTGDAGIRRQRRPAAPASAWLRPAARACSRRRRRPRTMPGSHRPAPGRATRTVARVRSVATQACTRALAAASMTSPKRSSRASSPSVFDRVSACAQPSSVSRSNAIRSTSSFRACRDAPRPGPTPATATPDRARSARSRARAVAAPGCRARRR